jgi:hypothetical protein
MIAAAAADVPAEAMPVDASRPARGAQFRVFAEQKKKTI